MALLKESYLRTLAEEKAQRIYGKDVSQSNAVKKALLTESRRSFSVYKSYDIFLSHSYLDKDVVLGLSIELGNQGYAVYVDWIEDPSLDRSSITNENALLIKERMKVSKSLLYAVSPHAQESRWMPWELGFMDGLARKVAICPIAQGDRLIYRGSEYLGLYPYLDKSSDQLNGEEILWITDQFNIQRYVRLSDWLKGYGLAGQS